MNTSQTLAMGVSRMGFLIRRLAEDCHPLQQYRELTENEIQAILRTPSGKGEIVWDVDWDLLERTGYYKLCCLGTGDGMSGPEMMEYINKLSSSIEEQGLNANFGFGAKIAGCTRNPCGMVYKSWQSGSGATATLWYDAEPDEYGLLQLPLGGDEYAYWAPLRDEARPELIREHGTVVTLLGDTEEQDTFETPVVLRKSGKTAENGRWLRRYLNTRYFRIPNGITIRVRDGYRYPREDTQHNALARVYGMEHFLSNHSRASGTVALSDAQVHWWVWRDKVEPGESKLFTAGNMDICATRGHIAALYQDELYELLESYHGVGRLQQFGILNRMELFVLYVEPSPRPTVTLTPNTARTHLLMGQQPLPWERWAAEFRKKMPEELRQIIESYTVPPDSDSDESIRQRLSKFPNLFVMKRYSVSGPGSNFHRRQERKLEVEADVLLDDDEDDPKPRQPRKQRPAALRLLGDDIKVDPGRGSVRELWIKDFPEFVWLSRENESRAPDYLEDRAANYVYDPTGGSGRIDGNKDFRGFQTVVDELAKEYQNIPSARLRIEHEVLAWYQQVLIETVMMCRVLQGGRFWTQDKVEKALSQEALTAACMPRYLILQQLRRVLGGTFASHRLAGLAEGTIGTELDDTPELLVSNPH
jgi:hypothetical protein